MRVLTYLVNTWAPREAQPAQPGAYPRAFSVCASTQARLVATNVGFPSSASTLGLTAAKTPAACKPVSRRRDDDAAWQETPARAGPREGPAAATADAMAQAPGKEVPREAAVG